MRAQIPITAAATLSLLLAAAHAQFPAERTVTDVNGRKLEATVLSEGNGVIKIRRKSDGKEFDFPLDKLSLDDRAWLESLKSEPMVETEAEAPETSPLPAPNPSPERELPNILGKDIPPFEEQIRKIEAIAVEFETTHNLPVVAKRIRNRISSTKSDDPTSIAKLSGFIREHPHADKWDDHLGCAFDLMRLAIIDEPEKALDHFFGIYWYKNQIPEPFVEDSFEIVKRHAASGNPKAVIALGCSRIYTSNNKNWPASDMMYLKKEFPDQYRANLIVSIEMLNKAILNEPSKELQRQMNELLATAYVYSGKLQEADDTLTKMGDKPSPHALGCLASDYLDANQPKKALKWFEIGKKLGINYENQITQIQNELKYLRSSRLITLPKTLKFSEDSPGEIHINRYGLADSDRAVVVFGSNTFSIRNAAAHLADIDSLFEAGWNLVIFDYPNNIHKNTAAPIHTFESNTRQLNSYLGTFDYSSGLASTVMAAIIDERTYQKIVLLGNSFGTGCIAWDLAALQQKHDLQVIFISPTEAFLPEITELEKLKNVTVIGKLDNDPFVRCAKLKQWIEKRKDPNAKEADLAEGHLILGDNIAWKFVSDYICALK